MTRLTPDEAMRRINTQVAHLWMVRTFLKHAELFEEDADRLAIPRALFDFARAIAPRYAAGDGEGYLKMARKKLPRVRQAAEQLSADEEALGSHTNFQQAALSLAGCVAQIEEILAAADAGN